MNRNTLCRMIDHTQLRATASLEDIRLLCLEALRYRFATVALHPCHIAYARDLLGGSDVGITAAISYPYGAEEPGSKAFEIEDAVAGGATDCDFVINLSALKEKEYKTLEREAEACRKAAGTRMLKAILEVCLLSDEEILTACRLYAGAGCDFVKTSTGFLAPPTVSQVRLMAEAVSGGPARVKAAGGIRSAADAAAMIEAGATRLGTSAGRRIYDAWEEE